MISRKNEYVINRWKNMGHMDTIEEAINQLRPYWDDTSIAKWMSVSAGSNTAKKIIDQFDYIDWRAYSPYNRRYAWWEYMVLLKLVYLKILAVKTEDVGCYNVGLRFRRMPDAISKSVYSDMEERKKLKPESLPLLYPYRVIIYSFGIARGALVMEVDAQNEKEALEIAESNFDAQLKLGRYKMAIGD